MKRNLTWLPALFFLLSSCNLTELAGEEEKKKDEEAEEEGATDEEGSTEEARTYDETADLIVTRLVGEDGDRSKQDREGRAIVYANKLIGMQFEAESGTEVSGSSGSGSDSSGSGSDSEMGSDDCAPGDRCFISPNAPESNDQTNSNEGVKPPMPCKKVTQEDGTEDEFCVGGSDGQEEPGDHLVEHCFFEIAIGHEAGASNDVFTEKKQKELKSECPDLIPVQPAPDLCGVKNDEILVGAPEPAVFEVGEEVADTADTEEGEAVEGEETAAEEETPSSEPVAGEEVEIAPIPMDVCAGPIETQISEGEKPEAILKEIIVSILAFFDKDNDKKLDATEFESALVVIIKALIN